MVQKVSNALVMSPHRGDSRYGCLASDLRRHSPLLKMNPDFVSLKHASGRNSLRQRLRDKVHVDSHRWMQPVCSNGPVTPTQAVMIQPRPEWEWLSEAPRSRASASPHGPVSIERATFSRGSSPLKHKIYRAGGRSSVGATTMTPTPPAMHRSQSVAAPESAARRRPVSGRVRKEYQSSSENTMPDRRRPATAGHSRSKSHSSYDMPVPPYPSGEMQLPQRPSTAGNRNSGKRPQAPSRRLRPATAHHATAWEVKVGQEKPESLCPGPKPSVQSHGFKRRPATAGQVRATSSSPEHEPSLLEQDRHSVLSGRETVGSMRNMTQFLMDAYSHDYHKGRVIKESGPHEQRDCLSARSHNGAQRFHDASPEPYNMDANNLDAALQDTIRLLASLNLFSRHDQTFITELARSCERSDHSAGSRLKSQNLQFGDHFFVVLQGAVEANWTDDISQKTWKVATLHRGAHFGLFQLSVCPSSDFGLNADFNAQTDVTLLKLSRFLPDLDPSHNVHMTILPDFVSFIHQSGLSPAEIVKSSAGQILPEGTRISWRKSASRIGSAEKETDDLIFWSANRSDAQDLDVDDQVFDQLSTVKDALTSCPAFVHLAGSDLDALIPCLEYVLFVRNDRICIQGERTGDSMYILFEGKARAEKFLTRQGVISRLQDYSAGDYFGEGALARNQPQSWSVVASAECKLVKVRRSVLMQFDFYHDIKQHLERQTNCRDIGLLRKGFEALDKDQDGLLSKQEVLEFFRSVGADYSSEELEHGVSTIESAWSDDIDLFDLYNHWSKCSILDPLGIREDHIQEAKAHGRTATRSFVQNVVRDRAAERAVDEAKSIWNCYEMGLEYVHRDRFRRMLRDLGYHDGVESSIDKIVQTLDAHNTGYVTLPAFTNWWISIQTTDPGRNIARASVLSQELGREKLQFGSRKLLSQQEAIAVFRQMDRQCRGIIEGNSFFDEVRRDQSLAQSLGFQWTRGRIDSNHVLDIFGAMDPDTNGYVTEEIFVSFWSGEYNQVAGMFGRQPEPMDADKGSDDEENEDEILYSKEVADVLHGFENSETDSLQAGRLLGTNSASPEPSPRSSHLGKENSLKYVASRDSPETVPLERSPRFDNSLLIRENASADPAVKQGLMPASVLPASLNEHAHNKDEATKPDPSACDMAPIAGEDNDAQRDTAKHSSAGNSGTRTENSQRPPAMDANHEQKDRSRRQLPRIPSDLASNLHPGLITDHMQTSPNHPASSYATAGQSTPVYISLDTMRRPRRSLVPVEGPDINDTNVREALKLDMFLRQVEALQHLTLTDREVLARNFVLELYNEGNKIATQGTDDGSPLFVILYRGSASMQVDNSSQSRIFHPGDILSAGNHNDLNISASVIARELCVVLQIPVESFSCKESASDPSQVTEISFAGSYVPVNNPVNNVEDRHSKLKAVFQFADGNGDGVISKQELGQLMQHMGIDMDNADLQELFDYIDFTRDGDIELEEFCQWWENMNIFEKMGPTVSGDADDEEDELRRRREAWGL